MLALSTRSQVDDHHTFPQVPAGFGSTSSTLNADEELPHIVEIGCNSSLHCGKKPEAPCNVESI